MSPTPSPSPSAVSAGAGERSGAPPRWDLTAFFASLDDRALLATHEGVIAGVDRLTALFDELGVHGDDRRPVDEEVAKSFDVALSAMNELQEEVRLVAAYLHAHVTADARDDHAAALQSQLQPGLARLRALSFRFYAWIGALGADALVAASPLAADHEWPLRKAETASAHQLTEPEEDLAAELNLTGASAWNRLHGEVTARLSADVGGEVLPITVVRNLAADPDPLRREQAYRAELEAWESVSVVLAAAMNAVKGEAVVLNRRRGWRDALEPALFINAVDPGALDAMHAATVASFPDFRRYLHAKARLLGHAGGLPWWDLLAPLGDPSASATTWDEATRLVLDAFGSYSPALQALAGRAFSEGWVDAEARGAKRGGAFCMPVRGDESRILMNFGGTVDSTSTLAHELGHAYHNTNLAQRTPLQRATPMALAETASIFCETILFQAALETSDNDARRTALLDSNLTGATQIVIDIHSRFVFERNVFERRAGRALSVSELNELMSSAQLETYGDGLDPDALHPYMWAVKPHYYSTAFYNWPYCFGLLFALGLYARFRQEPDRFRDGYDDLLSATGLADAATLASRFGIDVRDEAFWTSSLDVIRARIEDFDSATASR